VGVRARKNELIFVRALEEDPVPSLGLRIWRAAIFQLTLGRLGVKNYPMLGEYELW
jgi:hypothetical protein